MAGKLLRMRRDGGPKESFELPPGYSLEAGSRSRLLLRRADGSAVVAFAFSAFGPTPETIRKAAEEDRLGRRALEGAQEEEGGRGG